MTFGIGKNGITVAMLIVDYLEHCKSHYPGGKHSETNHTRLALKYLVPYYDDFAGEFGPLKLKTVRQAMLDAVNEKTGKALSRQYINKMIDRIVRMYRWGAENELVPIIVHQALANFRGLQKGRTTAPEAPPVKPVADEVVEATIRRCTQVVADYRSNGDRGPRAHVNSHCMLVSGARMQTRAGRKDHPVMINWTTPLASLICGRWLCRCGDHQLVQQLHG